MPLNIDFLQVLLHLLNFVILAGGLTFLLYKPVHDFMEKRRTYFAEAEAARVAAAEENNRLRAEYEARLANAEAEILERKKSGEKEMTALSAQYLADAEEKAAGILRAAEAEAEERKAHILESAQTEIGELVLASAQKLLSDTVTPERDSALYDAFIQLTATELAEERAGNDRS